MQIVVPNKLPSPFRLRDLRLENILEQLEAFGLDDSTIVVFTSDDGGLATSEGHPTANLPFRGGKGGSMKVDSECHSSFAGPG